MRRRRRDDGLAGPDYVLVDRFEITVLEHVESILSEWFRLPLVDVRDNVSGLYEQFMCEARERYSVKQKG